MQLHRLPIVPTVQAGKQCLQAVLTGCPERLAGVAIAPGHPLSRILFQLLRPFVPDSTAQKVRFFPSMSRMRDHLRTHLGLAEDELPDFFGGARVHAPPHTADGALDLVAMLRDLAEA